MLLLLLLHMHTHPTQSVALKWFLVSLKFSLGQLTLHSSHPHTSYSSFSFSLSCLFFLISYFALLAFCLELMKRPEEQVFVTHIYCLYKLEWLPLPALPPPSLPPPSAPCCCKQWQATFAVTIFFFLCFLLLLPHKRQQHRQQSCTYDEAPKQLATCT